MKCGRAEGRVGRGNGRGGFVGHAAAHGVRLGGLGAVLGVGELRWVVPRGRLGVLRGVGHAAVGGEARAAAEAHRGVVGRGCGGGETRARVGIEFREQRRYGGTRGGPVVAELDEVAVAVLTRARGDGVVPRVRERGGNGGEDVARGIGHGHDEGAPPSLLRVVVRARPRHSRVAVKYNLISLNYWLSLPCLPSSSLKSLPQLTAYLSAFRFYRYADARMVSTATVSYKKQPGLLSLTAKALTWSPGGGQGANEVDLGNYRIQCQLFSPCSRSAIDDCIFSPKTALFSSKEGGAKVMLRVGVLPAAPTAPPVEEFFNFTFIAASSALSDRERFKKEISDLVAANRERISNGDTSIPGDTPSAKGKERAIPLPPAPTTFHLRKKVLMSDPALAALHRDLVQSKMISEAEFWEGREDLILAASADEGQRKGRSSEMVDPRPETSEGGEVTVKITPTLIREIFEEYPSVLRAYGDNVPNPVRSSHLAHSYRYSRLCDSSTSNNSGRGTSNRNYSIEIGRRIELPSTRSKTTRSSTSTWERRTTVSLSTRSLFAAADFVAADLEPQNLQVDHIYRLLDLAATEQDQHEVRYCSALCRFD